MKYRYTLTRKQDGSLVSSGEVGEDVDESVAGLLQDQDITSVVLNLRNGRRIQWERIDA